MARHITSFPAFDLAARRAIEALRNGVPNRDAVRALGSNQPNVKRRFADLLDAVENAGNPPNTSKGLLLSGDFGAGKSHLLADLEHLALDRNFVCSRVPISKETPLYDLGKVFSSAMENGRVPDRGGRLVEELARSIKPHSEKYIELFQWAFRAARDGSLHSVFPASLSIYEHAMNLDLNGDIEAFWAGSKIGVSKIRAGLREIGETKTFGSFRAPKAAELPPQRMRFVIELMKASGYKGWVVLLDEIELIGFYSILQRGRSYAEIARWMGLLSDEKYPSLIVVGAITDDFASAIISPDGRKKDSDYIRPKLEQSARYNSLADSAVTGMRLLERESIALEPPGDAVVSGAIGKLQELYRRAYGFAPPAYEATAGGAGFQGRMRHKVRSAINEWDLRRLRPDNRPDTVIEDFETGYDENTDLESQTTDDPE